MQTIVKLPAFGCGVATVLLAHVLLGSIVAQSATGEVIDVCANAEGIMRLVEPGIACNAGERRVRLKEPDIEKPCEKQPRPNVEGLQSRVAQLEAEVDDRRLTSPVVAPFEVVNEAGIRVFAVEEEPLPGISNLASTEIYNDAGARVAVIAANAGGGAVTVESGTRAPLSSAPGVSASVVSATIEAHGAYLGVVTTAGSERRLALGRRENGRYALRVLESNGKMVAGIGESEAGSGIILVADAAGNARVRMSRRSSTGAGEVVVTNTEGKEIATLSGAGEAGTSLLQLTNNSGTVMVEAGMLDTGIGVVRAGPGAFQHGIGFLGLPGSYIEGRRP